MRKSHVRYTAEIKALGLDRGSIETSPRRQFSMGAKSSKRVLSMWKAKLFHI